MIKLVQEFLHYLWVLVDKWLFLMGVVMLIGDLVKRRFPIAKANLRLEKWLPRRTFAVLAIVCFFLAGFQAWHEEYAKTSPGLRLTLDEYGFATAMQPKPTGFGKGMPAILIATVRNTGAPTIADNWELKIHIPTRKGVISTRLIDFNIPNRPPIRLEGDLISMRRLLYMETEVPIATGAEKQGIIGFFVPGISERALMVKGTRMTLSCRDVAGNQISATAVLSGRNEPHRHFYGLE